MQRAGFMVLKSPDVPSILIETGFISNPDEERRLRQARHQKAVARAIATGIERYLRSNAPEGTLLASRRHVIARGETLSHVAARYEIPLTVLKRANRLNGDVVRVGQILTIPSASQLQGG